ncbi:MAG: Wzz/FepE/Etk N-terminal domain-containing protein [Gallionella sp.]
MQNEILQRAENEISIKDIAKIIKCNFKLIVGSAIAALLISAAYIILAPKQYEARWQMQMAQFSTNITSNRNNSTNSNNNSEEPAALVERLRSPTAYTADVQQNCGMPANGEFGDYLDKRLEIQTTRNMTAAVGMKYRGVSSVQVKQCAESIVSMIITQQRSMIEEQLAGRLDQLVKYQQTLAEEQRQLEKMNKSELGSMDFMARLDRLRWLRSRIDELQEESLLSRMHPAKLISPIYMPSKPISPKVGLVLASGLLIGLMLGILLIFGREVWRKTA